MATLAASQISFNRLPHPSPVPVDVRDAALADPGFGKLFSDHMVSIDWSEVASWHNATVGPLTPAQHAHWAKSPRSIPPLPCCTMPRKSSKG